MAGSVDGGLDPRVAAPLAAVAWAVGLVAVQRLGAAQVLAVTALLYGVLLGSDFHSNDLHRYLWEGQVQLAGENPYALPPDHPVLAPLRGERFERIVHPELPTVYPPLAQASFAAAACLGWDELDFRNAVLGLQWLLTGLICVWLARTGRPVGRAAWFAWSPVALASGATGHVDVLMAGALVGFAWAWESERSRLAAACLGLAVLSKTVAVLLVPWLLLRRPRAVLTGAVPVLALGVLPYLGDGGIAGSLPRFAADFRFNGSAHELLVAVAGDAAPLVAGVLLLVWVGWVALRTEDVVAASVRCLVGLLLLAPTVHYWYLLWWLACLPGLADLRWRAPLCAWAASITWTAPLYAAAVRGEADLPTAGYALLVGLEYAIPAAVAVAVWRLTAARGPAAASIGPPLPRPLPS